MDYILVYIVYVVYQRSQASSNVSYDKYKYKTYNNNCVINANEIQSFYY